MKNLTLRHSLGTTLITIKNSYDFLLLKKEYNGLIIGLVDQNLAKVLQQKQISNVLDLCDQVITIPEGESSKSFDVYQDVVGKLFDFKADRSTVLLAIGGGVTGDLCGFAASTFLRGIRYLQVPTTLLSQIDSSIGGKTGINHPRGKNLLGSFYQPDKIIIDPTFLTSLPIREVVSALGELLKYTILNSEDLFNRLSDYLEKSNPSDLLGKDFELLLDWIEYGVRSKVNIVEQDERETGVRAILNLGHTFGHAVEKYYGYENVRHGEAVSVGIWFSAFLSNKKNKLSDSDFERIAKITAKLIPAQTKSVNWDLKMISNFLTADKKMKVGKLKWIIPTAIGECEFYETDNFTEIENLILEFNRDYLKW